MLLASEKSKNKKNWVWTWTIGVPPPHPPTKRVKHVDEHWQLVDRTMDVSKWDSHHASCLIDCQSFCVWLKVRQPSCSVLHWLKEFWCLTQSEIAIMFRAWLFDRVLVFDSKWDSHHAPCLIDWKNFGVWLKVRQPSCSVLHWSTEFWCLNQTPCFIDRQRFGVWIKLRASLIDRVLVFDSNSVLHWLTEFWCLNQTPCFIDWQRFGVWIKLRASLIDSFGVWRLADHESRIRTKWKSANCNSGPVHCWHLTLLQHWRGFEKNEAECIKKPK